MKILSSLILSFCLLLAGGIVLAQETENSAEAVALDETVTAKDLGVAEPTVLPDSPFYFFKNLGRAIQSAVTMDPVKKATLREKFANEKLIELRKLTEKTQNSEVINKATENYRKEVENVKNAVDKIKEKSGENPEVGKFLDKFIQQQTLHQTILEKLAEQAPEKALEKIAEARQAHLEKFGQVMTRLENKEKIQERLETNLEKVEGSEFKNFKNLEMLQALEEKSPEAIKEAIQQVRVNVMTQLKQEVKEMTTEKLQQFQTYTENISGAKEKQLEIMEDIKSEMKETPRVLEKIEEGKIKILEKIKEKAGEKGCPAFGIPQIECDLSGGRWVYEKDPKTGCILSVRCVVPEKVNVEKPEACITLWDPVCGKDGKTYSNACFAKLAGIEIDYRGACKSLNTGTSSQIKEQIKRLLPNSATPSTP